MKKFAIVYSSENGQTAEIARFMAGILRQKGKFVEPTAITSRTRDYEIEDGVDTVIIGAPVYAGRFPKALRRWVARHRGLLVGKNVAFFSVSLNVADKRPEARLADDRLIRDFIDSTGLVPNYVASVAGALKYRHYGWLKRRLMQKISAAAGGPTDMSKDYEFTDWQQVQEFFQAVEVADQASPYFIENRFPGQCLPAAGGRAAQRALKASKQIGAAPSF